MSNITQNDTQKNIQKNKDNDKLIYYSVTKLITIDNIDKDMLPADNSGKPIKLVTENSLSVELDTKASFDNDIDNNDILLWNDNKIVSSECKINKNIDNDFSNINLIPTEKKIKDFVNYTINDYLANSAG
jgi:hypothetical protein